MSNHRVLCGECLNFHWCNCAGEHTHKVCESCEELTAALKASDEDFIREALEQQEELEGMKRDRVNR